MSALGLLQLAEEINQLRRQVPLQLKSWQSAQQPRIVGTADLPADESPGARPISRLFVSPQHHSPARPGCSSYLLT